MTTKKIFNELDVLRKNILDLQEQLQVAYKRIGELSTESEILQEELEPIPED